MSNVNTNLSDKELKTLLRRGVSEIIVEEEMVRLLKSGRKLRFKEGLDPSSTDIHLGHAVGLRKLRQFQDLGHQVVLIVGDWTAQIGDPSGASITRPMLTAQQVKANAETYMAQFFKIVDKEKTEVRWQSEWFGKFDLADVIRLTSKFTVAQFLARDDFSKRYSEGRPIAITELLYPLMQAYDSVAIQSDVECGGTDQKFNFLVGRELQAMMGQPSQQCFMTPLLVGTDGVQKMSKSLGNYIGITEPPEDIYGKTMSIRDDFILTYFEVLTDVPEKELADFKKQLNEGVNPMNLKKRLGKDLVTQLYSAKDADEAEAHFNRVVQKKEVPDEIEECLVSFNRFREFLTQIGQPQEAINSAINMNRLIVEIGLAKSNSEAGRLIAQGAVRIDGKKLTSNVAYVDDKFIINVGKRRFAKVINVDNEE